MWLSRRFQASASRSDPAFATRSCVPRAFVHARRHPIELGTSREERYIRRRASEALRQRSKTPSRRPRYRDAKAPHGRQSTLATRLDVVPETRVTLDGVMRWLLP